MARADSTHLPSHYETYDDLWQLFYAQRGCLAGAHYLSGPEVEDRDQLAGVMIALEQLAAEGERIAADARGAVPIQ